MDLTNIVMIAQAAGLGAWVPYGFAAVGCAASLAAVLPQAGPDSPAWWRAGRRVLDWCGANVGNARNVVRV